MSEQGGGGGHGVRLSVDWSPGGRRGDGHASGQALFSSRKVFPKSATVLITSNFAIRA